MSSENATAARTTGKNTSGKLRKIGIIVGAGFMAVVLLLIIVSSVIGPSTKGSKQLSAKPPKPADLAMSKSPFSPDQNQDRSKGESAGTPTSTSTDRDSAPPRSLAETLKEEEKQVLQKQGRYLGPVSSKETLMSRPPEPEESKQVARNPAIEQLFNKFVNATPPKGKILGDTKTKDTAKEKQQEQGKPAEKPYREPLPVVLEGKPYLAESVTGISNMPGTSGKFTAKILDMPLTNATLEGSVAGLSPDLKLHVLFNKMTYQGRTYPVVARAVSLDMTDGIVSHIKPQFWEKLVYVAGSAFLSKMLDTLRRDTQTVSQGWFSETTTQHKDPNRTREGLLAGGSAVFDEAKKQSEQYFQNMPDTQVYFMPGEQFYVIFDQFNVKPEVVKEVQQQAKEQKENNTEELLK